jgi:bifunctional DNA-binding transcriptional regulator/antitoxin component of YhaV-PrlF toxin-antitoxin module
MATTQTLKIERNGKIKLPKTLMEKYDFKPFEEIKLMSEKNGLRIEKISTKDPYDEFLKLLEDGLKGVSWEEIENEREDRCI